MLLVNNMNVWFIIIPSLIILWFLMAYVKRKVEQQRIVEQKKKGLEDIRKYYKDMGSKND